MTDTSWLNPHPDISMALIGRDMYKVIKTDKGWQTNLVVGKEARNSPIGEVQDTKLAAQLFAIEYAHTKEEV